MARVAVELTNFTGGELSPRLDGRTDLTKYTSGCSTLENLKSSIYTLFFLLHFQRHQGLSALYYICYTPSISLCLSFCYVFTTAI